MIVAFAKGLEFVLRGENQAKRSTAQWSVEAFIDKASSTLNTYWSQEYIYKQRHEYKELCFLKSLSQFLKVDAPTLKKIEALYRHMLKKETNGMEQKLVKKDTVVDFNEFKKNNKSPRVFKLNITDYLDSLYYEKHFLIFGDILKNKPYFLLKDWFSFEEINQLIESIDHP